jgi:acyl-CoA synthetase (AMP-forming)/AMP-acid ligase II
MGPGKADLEDGEILYGFRIEKSPEYNFQYYEKVGQRNALSIAIAAIAILARISSDNIIEKWDESLSVKTGETGEIVIDGDVVTPEYHNLPEHTAMAKIKKTDGTIMHRMGDMGFYDNNGYLWFKGRKAHRVITKNAILYPVCCEAIFNAHKKVFRSALIGIGPENNKTPIIIIQPIPGIIPLYGEKREIFIQELKELAAKEKHTAGISEFLFQADFPVDIRHNAKIFREKLTIWAENLNSTKS